MNDRPTTPDANLYGLAYQKLQTQLTKQGKYGELRLSTYLSARMNIDNWTFSAADITNQTGLDRTTTFKLCKQLVQSGMFKVKKIQGRTILYSFDEPALLKYLQGDTALDGLGKVADVAPNHHQCKIKQHCDVVSNNNQCCTKPQSMLFETTINVAPNDPIIKIYNKEKIKIHKEETCLCALTQSASQTLNPKSFECDKEISRQVKEINTRFEPSENDLANPDLSAKAKAKLFTDYIAYQNMIENVWKITDDTIKLAGEFFKANPNKPASYLTGLVGDVDSYSFSLIPHNDNDGYDNHFNIRRAHSLAYFFKHLTNVEQELNTIKAELGTL